MGGNVILGGESAERIDLRQVDRKRVVFEIRKGLQSLSEHFKMRSGQDLWCSELLESCQFLSGSALHLFNLDGISDSEFVKYKPTVGDIDTQVDETQKESIDLFLSSLPVGFCIDTLTFLGFKRTDQFVTLWKLIDPAINVQIDLELVAFDSGRPTAWSQFSHSSSWEDIKEGIKGVFQKYLLRSFQARNARRVIIQPKTSRGKEKILVKSEFAFSLKGLRRSLEPITDEQGTPIVRDDLPVYRELDSVGADYITDFDILFLRFFGVYGWNHEKEQMKSFVGIVRLMQQYLTKEDQKKVIDRFADLLWLKGAQRLARGNPAADYEAKIVAFRYLTEHLGEDVAHYQSSIDAYYQDYK
jgi:hypothetical protein